MKNLFTEKLTYLKNKSGIYQIIINNHIYIGSSINLYDRLLNHKMRLKRNKHHNKFIQSCYNKYKKCNFIILEECDKNILLLREKYWIDSLNPNLNFKLDPTTQNNCITTSKKVYQYDLNGKYINEYISVSEAARILKLNKNSISKCANNLNNVNKSYKNFIWSYNKLNNHKYINNSSKAKIKSINMYDINDNLIKTFNSIADAARYIFTNNDNFDSLCACISSVANGKGKFVKRIYKYKFN